MTDALPIIVVVIVVLVIATLAWAWRSSRGGGMIEDWAEQNGFRVLQKDYCWFWKGPFFWTTSRGQDVYYVTVEDRRGRVRRAWVRCGGWFLGMLSDNVDVEWDD